MWKETHKEKSCFWSHSYRLARVPLQYSARPWNPRIYICSVDNLNSYHYQQLYIERYSGKPKVLLRILTNFAEANNEDLQLHSDTAFLPSVWNMTDVGGDREHFPFGLSQQRRKHYTTWADAAPARWPDIQKRERNSIIGKADDSGWREGGTRINIYNFILWLIGSVFLDCISDGAS